MHTQGGRIAVGAIYAVLNNDFVGSVSVFERNGSEWTEAARLFAPNPTPGAVFGRALDLSDDRLVVGAPDHSNHPGTFEGAAYVFDRDASGWVFRASLQPSDLNRDDGFGFGVELDSERILVGSVFSDGVGQSEGTLYEFQWPRDVRPFCHCDVPTAPCGNADPTAGCSVDGAGGPGAVLLGSGSTSLAADSLELSVGNLPSQSAAMLFMSPHVTRVMLGDGQRCVGGPGGSRLTRFPVASANAVGGLDMGPGLLSASGALGQVAAGSTWYLQCWYTSQGGACGSGSNLTNALEVRFRP